MTEVMQERWWYASKLAPIDADVLAIGDSKDGYVVKRLPWLNLKVALKA